MSFEDNGSLGCLQLRGHATAFDIARLNHEMSNVVRLMGKIQKAVKDLTFGSLIHKLVAGEVMFAC